MTKQLELRLSNQRTEIARAQNELEIFAADHAIPERALHEAQLAFEEHLANVINHGYTDSLPHFITVRVSLQNRELRVEVEDDGQPFNPLEQPAPDLSLPLERRPIGGLGIYMMRRSLDQLEYRRVQNQNQVVMIKRF